MQNILGMNNETQRGTNVPGLINTVLWGDGRILTREKELVLGVSRFGCVGEKDDKKKRPQQYRLEGQKPTWVHVVCFVRTVWLCGHSRGVEVKELPLL